MRGEDEFFAFGGRGEFHGEEVVIAKAGRPVLRMVLIVEEKKVGRREFGKNAMGLGPIDLEAYPEAYGDLPLDMFEVLRDDDGGPSR